MRTSHRASSWSAEVLLALLMVALLVPTTASANSGALLWVRGVEIGMDDEEFVGMAKGPDASVYAVGRANYDAGGGDLLIAKFSRAGKLLWRRLFKGPAAGADFANAVAVDGAGNAYVTGVSMSASDGYDAITLKYSSAGARLWTKRYNGMADDYDAGADIALDGSGKPYVAMTSTVMGGANIVVVKYGRGGAQVWERMWAGPGEDDAAESLAVDQRGRAYVAGTVETFTQGTDAVLIRFTSGGGVKWSMMYDGTASLDDRGHKVMLRGVNAYLTGVCTRAGARPCFLAVKYRRDDGFEKWARVSDITGNVVSAGGFWVDTAGNVSVSGVLQVTGSEGYRGAIVSWNNSGVLRWWKTYYRKATDDGAGYDAMVGGIDGVLYCSGWVRRGSAYDSVVVRYRDDGSRVWTKPFNSDPYEGAESLCLLYIGGWRGGLYAGGTWSAGGGSYSALVLKYRP